MESFGIGLIDHGHLYNLAQRTETNQPKEKCGEERSLKLLIIITGAIQR